MTYHDACVLLRDHLRLYVSEKLEQNHEGACAAVFSGDHLAPQCDCGHRHDLEDAIDALEKTSRRGMHFISPARKNGVCLKCRQEPGKTVGLTCPSNVGID